MRIQLLSGAVALGFLLTDPAICAQPAPTPPVGSQPVPGETEDPVNPNPMPDPSNPTPPVTEPLPPEMPMPAGEAQKMPPMAAPDAPAAPPAPEVIDRSLPPGPPATPPSPPTNTAVSGSTTTAMMTPQAATKDYPLCSRTLQDNCRNPGEGPNTAKRR